MIGWWCKAETSHSAGRRLRAELVMQGLRRNGVDSEWFDARRRHTYECVVLAKRYDPATQEVAARLQANGCRVVLDLCDNHFVGSPDTAKYRDAVVQLRSLVQRVDHVVASTPTLAAVIAHECPAARAISVIGDLVDDLSIVPVSPMHAVIAKLHAALIVKRLAAAARHHTCLVWFGNHSGSRANAGLPDLEKIKPLLAQLHREFPIHLSVISNSRKQYARLLGNAGFPHLYAEWSPSTFERLLALHEIAIIPVELNAFTACKTDNRVVTSLKSGLAVVASEVPSYRRYAPHIRLGDIEQGLRSYLRDPELRRADAKAAALIAAEAVAAEPIIAAWRRALLPGGSPRA